MTAVIGILNRNGIALAADSAVTVTGGNNKKIYNSANKLWALSKYHPVGVMIYDSSTLIGTPWETIIKLYRNQLAENKFDTINGYKLDFLKFVKDNDYFAPPTEQLFKLKQFCYWQFQNIRDYIYTLLTPGKTEPELKAEFLLKLEAKLDTDIATYVGATNVLSDFSTYTIDQFKAYCETELNDAMDKAYKGITLTPDIRNKHLQLYFDQLRTTNFNGFVTGIVFAGYGDKDIFPALESVIIADAFDSKLRYYHGTPEKITHAMGGSIVPFAQTDVINMFIKGIDPLIDRTYETVFQDFLSEFNNEIIKIVEPADQALADQLKAIDINAISIKFKNKIAEVQRVKQIQPTVDTVAILSKEDLAEMAESLIYLTYLKRRMSSEDESVGGPIDVAIITKGDGFIWKKRKHYFDKELNQNFFSTYLKS